MKIKLTHPTHNREDGGDLNIPPLQRFADNMTCVIEEAEKNLLMMKKFVEEYAELSGLEITNNRQFMRFIPKHADIEL